MEVTNTPSPQEQSTTPADELELNWSRDDIERRLGFEGGRFTQSGNTLPLILGFTVTVLVFAALTYVRAMPTVVGKYPMIETIAGKFLDRGSVQYAIIFLFLWGWFLLWIKKRKLAFQSRALDLAALPQNPEFILDPRSAKSVLNRIHSLVDRTSHFVLLNRIERALSILSNVGQISDVSTVLNTQAKDDEEMFAASYNVVRGFVWAIPVLGFIGTVLGLGVALGSFGAAVQNSADVSALKDSLAKVTSGLETAFDTTLFGLVTALILQMDITFLQQKEFKFLDACNDYCHGNVISKLRLKQD
jgi:biopolymer transport protein ExbB/TolQ